MPKVTRVLETALYVDDLGRSADFWTGLGLCTLLDTDRLVALDAGGGTVLLLFLRGASLEGDSVEAGIPPHDGSGPVHLALAIEEEELEAWRELLAERGVAIESEQSWERGGTSLYFRDPDDHLVELATPGLWEVY